jgi:hypothetical protein
MRGLERASHCGECWSVWGMYAISQAMKRWHLPLMFCVLLVLFRYGVSPVVISADEVDALVAGSVLKERLLANDSLRSGFTTHANHPRAKSLRRSRGGQDAEARKRANLLTSPSVRWLVAGTMLLTGGDSLEHARWAGALCMALSLVLAFFFLLSLRSRWWLLGLLAVTPSTYYFASSAGAAATSCLAMTLLLLSLKGLRQKASPLWVGGAWGLSLAVHPATVWFLIPIFILSAMAYRRMEEVETSGYRGTLHLPTVPLSLFLVPVVALLVLVAVWPSLWKDTSTGLFYWISDSWRESTSGQVIAGTAFEQIHDRAPLAWTALLQWGALLPLTVLLAWCAGVWAAMKRGREGDWAPILLALTLLLAGGLNGGLFGGRLSLFGVLLMPTLVTAAQGAVFVWERYETTLRQRFGKLRMKPVLVYAALVLGVGGFQAQLGMTNLGPSNGLDAALPMPYALLTRLSEETKSASAPIPITLVGGDTLSQRGSERWKHAIWTLSQRTAAKVAVRSAKDSRWLLVLDADPLDMPDESTHVIPDGDPKYTEVVAGVRWDAYEL